MWEEVRADANARITHCKLSKGIESLQLNSYLSSLRCEFDRVCEQIRNHLLQALWIAHHHTRGSAVMRVNSYPLVTRRDVHDSDRISYDRAEVYPARFNPELS